MRIYFKKFICRLLRNKISVSFISKKLSKKLIFPNKNVTKTDSLRVLILNHERWLFDLAELGKDGSVELVYLPVESQHWFNAIHYMPIKDELNKDPLLHQNPENHKKVLKYKNKFFQYLRFFLPRFCKDNNIKAILTCNFYYKQDKVWDEASEAVGIPFLALHKECLKDELTEEFYIDRYAYRGYSFKGTNLGVYNEREKRIMVKAGVCEAEKIKVLGCMRMDPLIQKPAMSLPLAKQVVLFSFRHMIAGIKPKSNMPFDDPQGEGVVKLFEKVHGEFARMALSLPNVKFVIKPKWLDLWEEKIQHAVLCATGKKIEEIPNLVLTVKDNAQTLINCSNVIIGINTTTLIESRIAGRVTIIPFFEEAANKYKNKVYYQKYSSSEFIFSNSIEQFKDDIKTGLDKENLCSPSEELIEEYLGYSDGLSTERVVTLLNELVKK